MNEINFDYFLDDIVPSIVGAEIPLVMLHIRNSAIRFCEKSWAWQMDGLPINVMANDATYNLASPNGRAEIVQIISAELDGESLSVTSLPAIKATGSKALLPAGQPKFYWQEYVEQLNLFPMPNAPLVAGLTYRIALRPSRIADGMDGSVAKRYFDAISDGAKASLYEIPNKPWSDGQASVFHTSKFNAAVYHAKTEVMRGLGRGPIRTKLFK